MMLRRVYAKDLSIPLEPHEGGLAIFSGDLHKELARRKELCTQEDVAAALLLLTDKAITYVPVKKKCSDHQNCTEYAGQQFWQLQKVGDYEYSVSGPWKFADAWFKDDEEIIVYFPG